MPPKKALPQVLANLNLPVKVRDELASLIDYGSIDLPTDVVYYPNLLVSTFIKTLGRAYASGIATPENLPPGYSLATLFDLVVNTIYARQAVDQGWIYCRGTDGNLPPSQFYTFIGACPRCTISGATFPAVAHKPPSSNIGDATGLSMILILRQTLALMTTEYQLAGSARRQGDIDVFIYGADLVTLAEVKASPLVTYPLEVVLEQPLTAQDADGNIVPYPNHEKNSPRILSEATNVDLYVPHLNIRIPLGQKNSDYWLYPALITWISHPDNLVRLVQAWMVLFDLYTKRVRAPALNLTHGCGTPISDSKNMPGLDRTDDIKKGTYQVLKYGAYYAAESPQRVVKCALLGNVHSVVHFRDYLQKLEDVVWTKEELLKKQTDDEYSVRKTDLFNLYDGIICFTRSIARNDTLGRLFNWDELALRLISLS